MNDTQIDTKMTPGERLNTLRSFIYLGREWSLQHRGKSWFPAFRVKGNRPRLSLNTGVFDVAVIRAKQILDDAHADRWDDIARMRTRQESSRVADALAVYRRQLHVTPRTMAGNEWSLLHMLRMVRGASVDPTVSRLSELTAGLVSSFQSRMAESALATLPANSPEWRRRQEREDSLSSSRSVVNQARSVFSSPRLDLPAIYAAAGVVLPDSLDGFLQTRLMGRVHKPRRPDQVTPPAVVDGVLDAAVELAKWPGALELFWLAVGCGLRKSECDQVEWSWLLERDGWQWIVGGLGKNGETIQVAIQPRAWAAIEGRKQSCGRILGGITADHAARRVNAWLRSKGWLGPKVLHDLRAVLLSRAFDRDPAAGKAMARHHELGTLMRHYAHHAGARPVAVL